MPHNRSAARWGLAIFSALATSRTADLLASQTDPAEALTSGFRRALTASSLFLLAAAVIALRIANARGEEDPAEAESAPDAAQPVTTEPAISSTY